MLAVRIDEATAESFEGALSRADIAIMESTRQYPNFIAAVQGITGYRKTRIANAINGDIVRKFKNAGVVIFGDSVKDAKVLIPRWLDEHPGCQDGDPIRCFNKILYWLSWEWNIEHSPIDGLRYEELE